MNRPLWFKSPWSSRMEKFGLTSAKDFLEFIFTQMDSDQKQNVMLYAFCLLEHVWRTRNEMLFDACLREGGTIGAALARDANGSIVSASSTFFAFEDPLIAESAAPLEGIKLALDNGCKSNQKLFG
ncbi:hypothetical protein TorRG33x02_174280 [Trema orientale]|uniref:RNase H type-1 domain-containing protein n=1 Tax=Trema orientale TaxID=63057 RepID=A0A2P5EMP4_TREOI|nr:hypothetical protein TorRG33x02_174280 [Trema orientale]